MQVYHLGCESGRHWDPRTHSNRTRQLLDFVELLLGNHFLNAQKRGTGSQSKRHSGEGVEWGREGDKGGYVGGGDESPVGNFGK